MNWNRVLTILGAAALVLGLMASATEGVLHRALLTATFLSGVVLVVFTVHGFPAGPGIRDARIDWVHRATTIVYLLMVISAVMMVLVRTGIIPGGLRDAALRAAPTLVGFFVALLCVVLALRQGIRRDPVTILTGRLIMVGSVPVAAAGALLLRDGAATIFGYALRETDLLIFVFLGTIAAATQVLIVAELPTALAQLRTAIDRAQDPDATVEPWPPIAVAAVWASLAAGVAAFSVPLTGGAWLAAVVGAGALAFGATFAYYMEREARRGLVAERMSAHKRNQIVLYSSTGLAGGVLLLLFVGVVTERIARVGPFEADGVLAKDLLVAAILVTAGPIGWFLHREERRVDAIETRLPDLLNDLAENRRAGLTLPAAMQAAAQADYGALTVEVRRMAKQVAWGVSFNEAMSLFADRIRSALVRRTVYLIIEASRTGGSVADILRAAGADAYEIKSLESERRVTMLTYLIVIYVVFVVFLAVIGILDARFVPEVLAANQAAIDAGPTGRQLITISQEELQFVYFNAGIIQSIGNGLLGGVLAYGRVRSGLRHVALMTFMTWALFRFLLPL